MAAPPPREPKPAYPAKDSAVLYGDKAFYERLARTSDSERKLIEQVDVPIRSGRAWKVPKGHLFRISTPHGPQVGDLNIWSLQNPRERFWASRTRQLHASHLTTGDRLWSCLPYLRPLCTIISDSLSSYGQDEFGGRCHDLLGTRCDPYVTKLLSGDEFDYCCHSNLVRAVRKCGLEERDVHDVLNVFQVTGLNGEGKYWMGKSPATGGVGGKASEITFFAETDLLCAVSACPGGDLSVHGWGEEANRRCEETCRPLRVEVLELTGDGVLDGWSESRPVNYEGGHGMVGVEWVDRVAKEKEAKERS